jgi:hypothetical protein
MILVAGAAQADTTETRQRFMVVNGDVKFTVTRVDRTSETLSSTTVLVIDEKTRKAFRLESKRNYAAQTADYRFTDVVSKEYVAARYALPLKAKTRSETAVELQRAAGTTAAVDMTLSTGTAAETLDEMSWRSETRSRRAKEKVRGTLSTSFTAALEDLQTVLSVPPLSDFCYELVSHVQAGGCEPNPLVRLATLPPDCGFDAAQGEPCSKEQRKRADDIRKAGRGNRY